MPNLEMVEKCQPNSIMTTKCISQPNLCRQTLPMHHHYSRFPNSMLCPPLSPFVLLVFLFFLMAQQRNGSGGADAFLLAHRKMLLPFASSRIGAYQNDGNIDTKVPAHLVGLLVLPKRNGVTTDGSNMLLEHKNHELFDHGDQLGTDDDKQLLNGGDEAKNPTINNGFGTMEEQQNEDDGEAATDADLLMVKRMHHLSILRKIGSPGAGSPASRLFGPLRQRELKRRSWMIQY